MNLLPALLIIFIFSHSLEASAQSEESCEDLAGFEKSEIEHRSLYGENALEICLKEYEKNPNDAHVNFLLGRAYNGNEKVGKAMEYYLRAHELGHLNAAAMIALLHYYEQDHRKYFEWAKTAHEKGSPLGTKYLADAFMEGEGVLSNWDEAITLYTQAHSKGLAVATRELANIYAEGLLGQEQNTDLANELWDELKIQGSEYGWLDQAIFWLQNPKSPRDVENAIIQLTRLTNLGYTRAMGFIAFVNMRPENFKFTDTEQVKRLLNKEMAFEVGLEVLDTEAMLLNFDDFFFKPEFAKTLSTLQIEQLIDRLEEIAHGEDLRVAILANHILALFQMNGVFGAKNISNAIDYFKHGIDNHNDHISADYLSKIYQLEPGFIDPKLALKYARFATKNPDPWFRAHAHTTLGAVLTTNKDIRDFSEARHNFEEAAKIIEQSEYTLPEPYEYLTLLYAIGGHGLTRDLELVKLYASKIKLNGGDPFPEYFLNRYPIATDSTVEDIANKLEQAFYDGKAGAAKALSLLHNATDNNAATVQWATVCSIVCEGDDTKYYAELADVLRSQLLEAERDVGQDNAVKAVAGFYNQNKAQPRTATNISENNVKRLGNLHALLIGNALYENLQDLETPIRDIRAIGKVIEERFGGFTTYVENGTRREIMNAFNQLQQTVGGNDSLIIFYAGHGELLETQNEGYWLPSDSDQKDEFNWISNSYIKSKIRALEARNILLVADSCFSGFLTRGVNIKTLETNLATEASTSRLEEFQKTKSRVVISSGGLEPVLDGIGNENSIFANELISLLNKGQGAMTSTEIYSEIRDRVVEKSIKMGNKQVPFMGALVEAGHEGPDFVLIPD